MMDPRGHEIKYIKIPTFVAKSAGLIVTLAFIYLLINIIPPVTGLWDKTVPEEGEFIEIVKNDKSKSLTMDRVKFVDLDGFEQRHGEFKIKVNKKLEETRVVYDRVYRFDKPVKIKNLIVEYPSNEYLTEIKNEK